MKTIAENTDNNIDTEKNSFQFLHDVLGKSILIEDLDIKNNTNSTDNKNNKYLDLINIQKPLHLQFTFFNNPKDNNKDDAITLYLKSRIIKDGENNSKNKKIKIYIDNDNDSLLNAYEYDEDDKNTENNKNNENDKPRNYALYNIFYTNDKTYIKGEKSGDVTNIDDIDIRNISKDLRGTYTLKANDTNSYLEGNVFFIICEKGFTFCRFSVYENNFKQTLILFLLAVAYQFKMNNFLNKGAKLYSENKYDIEKINKLQESIHAFNLQFFFENPVLVSRYQLRIFWNIIAKNYDIKAEHDEVNTQILELTKLLEDKKREKFNKNIAIIGVMLAVAPFIIEITNLFIKESNIYGRLIAYVITIIFVIITVMHSFIWEKIKNILNKIHKE